MNSRMIIALGLIVGLVGIVTIAPDTSDSQSKTRELLQTTEPKQAAIPTTVATGLPPREQWMSPDNWRADVPLNIDSIQQRVRAIELTEQENVWSRIPWVRSLEKAKRLSKESGRPIFFFSMYGELDGRC